MNKTINSILNDITYLAEEIGGNRGEKLFGIAKRIRGRIAADADYLRRSADEEERAARDPSAPDARRLGVADGYRLCADYISRGIQQEGGAE